MAQVIDIGSVSFILVCTKNGAGSWERNAWIASGSAQSSRERRVLLPLAAPLSFTDTSEVARVTALCKAWSKSLVGSLKEAATTGGSHAHFSFAWRGGGVGAALAVLCRCPPPCTRNSPWVLQGRFLQQPGCSGIQDCGGCKVCIIWTVPKFLCGSDKALQGKCCKTKHGFQSESSALPSPREGCSGEMPRLAQVSWNNSSVGFTGGTICPLLCTPPCMFGFNQHDRLTRNGGTYPNSIQASWDSAPGQWLSKTRTGETLPSPG